MADSFEPLIVAERLRNTGRLEDAERAYRQILTVEPNRPEAWHGLGVVLYQAGRYEDAARCIGRALQLKPDFAEAHNTLGLLLKDQEKFGEAAVCFQQAVQLLPTFAEAHNNLGAALRDDGKPDDAVHCYHRAIEVQPAYTNAYNNLGLALQDLGMLNEAAACYRRALELQPDHAGGHVNQSLLRLLTGDFERGWPEYEWRWSVGQLPARDFSCRKWDGTPHPDSTILLHAEQGLGDTIQFIRYLPLVNSFFKAVVVEVQKPIVKLLSSFQGIDRLVAAGDDLPAFDFHAPLLSLPGILKTSLSTIPATVPYLFTDATLVSHWRERLESVSGFRIGINWHGRPGKGAFRNRNIPLDSFALLTDIPGVQLVSLQKGAARNELIDSDVRQRIHDFGNDIDQNHVAFMDTAAIMKNLDLVIASDTSIPHLAGALGVPVWLALPFAPDWRWLLNRHDSPWYPTMRLFRQSIRGDWSRVFAEMHVVLRVKLESRIKKRG